MKIGSATLVEKIDRYKVYILIAVPIVLFNWIAIFGVDVLVADDAAQYYGAIEYTTFRFKFIHRFIGHITHGLTFSMMTLSPELIRAIYVFFVMVPLSCLFYHLYHKKMGFPGVAAYCAAVLPNMLPGQIHIPAFVNGTHVSLGLLAWAACLLASFRYLYNQDPKKWPRLLTAALLYLLATQITDQPVFSFPVLLFALWGYHRLNKKHLFLAASFFLVFLYKAASIILEPRGSSSMILPTFTAVVKRMRDYFLSMLPLPEFLRKEGMILGIIVILIVITGLVLHIKNRSEEFRLLKPFAHLSHKTYTFYIYGFLFIWLVTHIIAFIAMSPKGFRARYTYYSAYGLNGLLILSLYPLLKNIFHKKNKLIPVAFIVILFISGVSRFIELKTYYGKFNANQAKIIKHLNQFKFPGHSQIVLHLTDGANFWGIWYQSSGHLKFMLKRDDIDGLIGDKRRKYFNFYNPFNTASRGFGKKAYMRGIDIKRPLFLFVETNKKFKQYQYALQWKEKAGEPEWTIFHFDKQTGKASPVLTGKGIDEYYAALKDFENKGIRQKDILWGGTGVLGGMNRRIKIQ